MQIDTFWKAIGHTVDFNSFHFYSIENLFCEYIYKQYNFFILIFIF